MRFLANLAHFSGCGPREGVLDAVPGGGGPGRGPDTRPPI